MKTFITIVFMLIVSCGHVFAQDRHRHDLSSQDGFESYADDVFHWFEEFGKTDAMEWIEQSSAVVAYLSDCVYTNFGTRQRLHRQKLLCLGGPTFVHNLPLMIVVNRLATKRDAEKLFGVFRYSDFLFTTVVHEKHQQFMEASSNYGKHYISKLNGGSYHESKVASEDRFEMSNLSSTDENIAFFKEIRAAYKQGRWDDLVSLTEQEINSIRESIQ